MQRHLSGLALAKALVLALILPLTLRAAGPVPCGMPAAEIPVIETPAAQTPATEAAPAELPAAPESYPLTRCPVSGSPLGGMGNPIVVEVEGMTVQLCCASCSEDAPKRSAEIRKALVKALVKRDGGSYPLASCVACGQALPAKPIELVHGSTLIRVDQEACAAELAEHGAAWSLQVRQARAAQEVN